VKWISLLSLFIASPAFADNAFDIDMNLDLNGKHIFSPQVLTLEGKTTTITKKIPGEDDVFLDVIADFKGAQHDDGIYMKFVVGRIDAKGNRKILYSPQIVSLENQTAEISVGSVKTENLTLSVTANTETY
jgi:type II secretory pathway component GspD/PulD (secretin)